MIPIVLRKAGQRASFGDVTKKYATRKFWPTKKLFYNSILYNIKITILIYKARKFTKG